VAGRPPLPLRVLYGAGDRHRRQPSPRQPRPPGGASAHCSLTAAPNDDQELHHKTRLDSEDDLLALPAGLASELWCGWLPYYLDRHPDAFLPATLEGHNATIQQLIDHPEQRERLDDGYVIYLRCLEARATRWPMHRVRVPHLRGEADSTCQQPVTSLTS
jgi:hypothetical protein